MPIQRIKWRCRSGHKCLAPLHGEIKIVSCGKGCKLGCDE